MGRMSELYGDIKELFDQGLSDEAIAIVTGMPITMVSDCTEQFYDELDEEEGFDFDEVAAEDFSFDEIEY
jgi:hypothetical protein